MKIDIKPFDPTTARTVAPDREFFADLRHRIAEQDERQRAELRALLTRPMPSVAPMSSPEITWIKAEPVAEYWSRKSWKVSRGYAHMKLSERSNIQRPVSAGVGR